MVRITQKESNIQTLETIPENSTLPSSSNKRKSQSLPQLKFTSTETQNKYLQMKKHVFTENSINFQNHQQALSLLKAAHLDTFVIYHNQTVYHHQTGEFFCNIKPEKYLNGKEFFNTSVTGRTLLIDEEILRDFLGLPQEVLELPHLEETEFNLKDFHAFLKVLCGCDVPVQKFELECAVCLEYFTPTAQLLALIFRSNIAPKITSNKFYQWFTFSELKFLHDVMIKEFKFKVPHFVMTSMLKAYNSGFLVYGLLLTDLFQHFHINLTGQASFNVTTMISEAQTVSPIPLDNFTPFSKHITRRINVPVVKEISKIQEMESRLLAVENNNKSILTLLEDLERRVSDVEEVVEVLKKKMGEECATKEAAVQVDYKEGFQGKDTTVKDFYEAEASQIIPFEQPAPDMGLLNGILSTYPSSEPMVMVPQVALVAAGMATIEKMDEELSEDFLNSMN